MFIGIAGIIGAGKTTLTTALAEHYGGKAFFEPVETNPYLEDFYKDMPRWGFTMQMYLLAQRFLQHQQLVWATDWETWIQDRTIYEDICFARLLHRAGYIDDRDFATYESHLRVMTRFLVFPDVVVYLDVTPERALERIVQRARGCEVNVTVEYLRDLRTEYERLLGELRSYTNVVRVDWENPRAPLWAAGVVAEKIGLEARDRPFSRTLKR